jgi:hypothetical protein
MTDLQIILAEIRELKESMGVPTYLKVSKAAEYLSMSENALRVMCFKGQIKYIKKQGKLYFRLVDLIEWFESGSSEEDEIDAESILLANKRRASSLNPR